MVVDEWKLLANTVSERASLYQTRLSTEDIEDISQEALIRLLHIPDITIATCKQPYIDRTLRSSVLDLHKRRKGRVKEEPYPDDMNQEEFWAEEETEKQAQEKETAAMLLRLIHHLKRTLPLSSFNAVLIRGVLGKSLNETAADLGISRSTVQRRISIGQEAARQWRNDHYGK